jgi:hypothetical protein
MTSTRRTARKSTGHQPTGQLVPRNVPPQPEPQHDSPQYIPQGDGSFEIVVTVPAGEDTQEAQQMLKDETFHDAHEIKTFGDEALIPTGRLRDLLNRINITTPPEFRIKRISCPGQEEYKAIMEIISGPNVLS